MRHTATRSILSLVLLAGIQGGCHKGQESSTQAPAAPDAASAPAASGQQGAAEPVDYKVERIDLGTAIGTDNKIKAPATKFKPTDTIYASIVGEGHAARVTLRAQLYSQEGPLVGDASQYVEPNGLTISEFHLSNPGGWPAGKYKLQLSVNENPASSAELTVAE